MESIGTSLQLMLLEVEDNRMSNLFSRPANQQNANMVSKYSCFSLTENPFPTAPVNKNSSDKRINGGIYETHIRCNETEGIETSFLKVAQTNPSHLRLGYICDTSYIGRGNGKSAFIVNLIDRINAQYCMNISSNLNKCFAVYLSPQPGGRTKTFDKFVDLLFESLFSSKILKISLAIVRLEAISVLYPDLDFQSISDADLVSNLNDAEWLSANGIDCYKLTKTVCDNQFFQALPSDSPFTNTRSSFIVEVTTDEKLYQYYRSIKNKRLKLDFVFTELVALFMAAGFNGSYIFVDDFERVPDFQSARQKRDFATELRSVLLDGPFDSARLGFYNMLLVLHAGVTALILEAWASSGLDQRYPLSPKVDSPHLVQFNKLNKSHIMLIVKKYLQAYRAESYSGDALAPFTVKSIELISEKGENNAATILKTCATLLETAVIKNVTSIDEVFVRNEYARHLGIDVIDERISDGNESINLLDKAHGKG